MQHDSLFRLLFGPDMTRSRQTLQCSSIQPLQLIQNTAARFIFNEPKRTISTGYLLNALMFAYRTTSLSKCITSDLYALAKLSERRFTEPSQRATQSLSQTFTLTVPIRWNNSILRHRQETAQNTSLFNPPTPAHSIIILFDLISRVFIKNTHI